MLLSLRKSVAAAAAIVGLGIGLAGSCWTALAGPTGLERFTCNGKDLASGISADQFDALRRLIKPRPGGFDDIPWMTDLREARTKAAAEGKPLLVWVGDGHPLGWT